MDEDNVIGFDTGIPIPPARRGKGKPSQFPWATMPVGSSISVNAEWKARARASAAQYKMYHVGEWNYTVRSQPDGSIRIWRIAPLD